MPCRQALSTMYRCIPCVSCCCSSWHDGRLLPQYAYLSGALSGVMRQLSRTAVLYVAERHCLYAPAFSVCVLLLQLLA
jgi:hypothetical protein